MCTVDVVETNTCCESVCAEGTDDEECCTQCTFTVGCYWDGNSCTAFTQDELNQIYNDTGLPNGQNVTLNLDDITEEALLCVPPPPPSGDGGDGGGGGGGIGIIIGAIAGGAAGLLACLLLAAVIAYFVYKRSGETETVEGIQEVLASVNAGQENPLFQAVSDTVINPLFENS